MRISIDATGLGEYKTGTAVYIVEILSIWSQDKTIAHDFLIFASPKAKEHLLSINLDDRFKIIDSPNNRLVRAVWQHTFLAWKINQLNVDVHWGVGFILPLLSNRPMVVSIFDLTFQLFPEVHERFKRLYFPAMIRFAVNHAKYVIAISETTRNDLYRLLPNSKNKTVVTLLAARKISQGNKNKVVHNQVNTDSYILFTGTVEPRKNLARLISAWQAIDTQQRKDIKLYVVGATGWLVENLLKRPPHEDNIEFKGFVSDERLSALMQDAMAFVYPSLYEGFGLPVLEAMANGIPVLTSNTGATKEIADGAALLVDPTCIASIKEGLIKILSQPEFRLELATKGLQRAATFTWKKTAQETLLVIQKAANS
jgi:glycosyltransferase involved in cell wall biosynthesis